MDEIEVPEIVERQMNQTCDPPSTAPAGDGPIIGMQQTTVANKTTCYTINSSGDVMNPLRLNPKLMHKPRTNNTMKGV